MPEDGFIINAKGHLHDGGVQVLLTLNDRVICDSRAIYGGDGSSSVGPNGKPWETIREMTQCTDAIAIKKGDVISMRSVYDTSLHPL
jgi:Stress up-regulated Nod 19